MNISRILTSVFTCMFLASCSVTIVYAPKEIKIRESEQIEIEQTGSKLNDNELHQSSEGTLKYGL